MNSKVIKTYNLPYDLNIIYRLEVKPTLVLVGIFILGLFTTSYSNLGIVLSSIAIFGLFFLPSQVLMDFTNDFLILYNRASKTDCVIVYYDEIVKWQYQKGRKVDTLIIDLIDGRQEKLECFNRFMIVKYLNDFAPNKEIIKK